MKKILAKIMVICMCFMSVFQGFNVKTSAAAPLVTTTIQINWEQVISKTTPFSYGLNAFAIWNPEESHSEGYNKNMAYMNPGLLRLHSWEMMGDSRNSLRGWIDYENQTWNEEKIIHSLSGLTSINPNMLMNIPGWPSWMDENDDEYLDEDKYEEYAAFCAELVRIVNVVGGFNIKYWEPTNERDDIYFVKFVDKLGDGSTVLKDPNVPDRLDELIDIYNQCAKAMKEVDPTIKTGGLAFARQDMTEQVRRLIQATKTETNPTTLDFLTYHFYASGDPHATYDMFYNRIKSFDGSNTLSSHTKDLQDILDQEGVDIPMWMDECNIYWSWDINAAKMHTHQAAVYETLTFIYAHLNGADGIAAWNEKDGAYGKFDDGYNLRPSAHVYQLFNNYMVGDVANSISSAENKVVSFAVKNGEDRSFVLVNRTDNVQSVATNFIKDSFFTGSAKMHQVSEAGYHMYSEEWNNVINQTYYLPANSVTLFTNSSKNPTVIPEPIEEKASTDAPNFLVVLEDEYRPSYHSTFEGNVDWLHFGSNNNPSNVDRKTGVSPLEQINYTRFGTSEQYSTNFWFSTSWTNGDGAPLAEMGDSNVGIRTEEMNDGYEFYLPASTDLHQAYIYWGAYKAKAKIEIEMSDGSIEPYEGLCDSSNDWGAQLFTKILYKTDTDHANLIVRITLIDKYQGGGDMKLKGITINNLEPTPGVLTISEKGVNGIVDLSSEGTLDWAFWGGNGLIDDKPTFEHKAGVPPLISNVTVVSGTSLAVDDWTVGNGSQFSWSDGSYTVSMSEAKTRISFNGGGKGLEFTVPAGTEAKTLKLYGGVLGCSARLEVSLFDTYGQLIAPPINKQIRNSGWVLNVEETIQFRAPEEGSLLKVRYLFNANDWGNSVWLSAAALTTADVMPPSAPANVATEHIGATTAVITWDESTDDIGVEGYKIYIGETLVATTGSNATSYYLQGLIPSTNYQITVKAFDAQGNISLDNEMISVPTISDQIAPTAVGNLRITNKTNNSISLEWNSSTDNVKMKEYIIVCDNAELRTTNTHYTLSGLTEGRYYDIYVYAIDVAGNQSDYRNISTLLGQPASDPGYENPGNDNQGNNNSGNDNPENDNNDNSDNMKGGKPAEKDEEQDNVIAIELDKLLMYVGGTTGKIAKVNTKLPKQILVNGSKLSYSSSNTSIITINSTGEVTANKVGSATITIIAELVGGSKRIYEVPVSVEKAYVTFTSSHKNLINGKKYAYDIKLYGYDMKDITWHTLVKKVAVVSRNVGKTRATVTAKSTGKDYIVIKSKGKEVLRLVVNVTEAKKTSSPVTYYSYVVKKGDTLAKISKQYSCTIDEIVKLNELRNRNLIQIGQKLKLPRK